MAIHDEGQFQRLIADELVASGGWAERPAADVDKSTRLIVDDLAAYLQATQPAAVEQFANVAGPNWAGQLADIVAKDPVGVPTDPDVLYETWQRIQDAHVIDDDDVAAFAAVWFTGDPDRHVEPSRPAQGPGAGRGTVRDP